MSTAVPVPPPDPRGISAEDARVFAESYLGAAVDDVRHQLDAEPAAAQYWAGRMGADIEVASALLMPGDRSVRWAVVIPVDRAVRAGQSVAEVTAVATAAAPHPAPVFADDAEDHAYDFIVDAMMSRRAKFVPNADPAEVARKLGRADVLASGAELFLTRGDLIGGGPVAQALLQAVDDGVDEAEELRTCALLGKR